MAQADSVQNLYYAKKHRGVVFGGKDYQPGKHAFYIYRNCVYYLVLNNKKEISAKIAEIRNDSIYYTLYDAKAVAADTFAVHPGRLRRIRMIADRSVGILSGYSLRKCRYQFINSDSAKAFKVYKDTIYTKDSSASTVYDVVPYLTAQGIDWLYQQCGKTYYYEGIGQPECEDTTKKSKPPIVKKWAWFTPSNANVIKGVNIGIQTAHLKDEPLTIDGVNLNADILGMFVSCFALMHLGHGNSVINMEDTVDKSITRIFIKGLSLSFGGLMGDSQIKGVSVNGGVCSAVEAKGLVITGTQNLSTEFSGVMITGLRNIAIKGNGVQMGLLNVCKHLKGFQFGLWNINSKRKLPFINWCF